MKKETKAGAGISTMVIPVEIKWTVEELSGYFSNFKPQTKPPLDTSKYFDFLIRTVSEEKSAILNPYTFHIDNLKYTSGELQIAPVHLFTQAHLAIDGRIAGKDKADDTSTSITEHTHLAFGFKKLLFLHNPGAGLGYFCVPFYWKEPDAEGLLSSLAETSFFRFIVGSKNKFLVNEGASMKDMSVLDALQGLFPQLFNEISQAEGLKLPRCKVIGNKPVVLHTLRWAAGQDIQQQHRRAYQVLRVSKRQGTGADQSPFDQSNTDFISSILLDTSIGMYLMNEGALVLDSNEDAPALWKKYFATFLLAVNQRQLLIHLVSQIMAADIKVPILNKDETKGTDQREQMRLMNEAKRTMENLHTTIIQLQLKQIFYSVAYTDELNLLLLRLQERFRISDLLQDIKDSVGELHQILEAISAHDNWLREKKRELAINLAGLIIGALGGISTIEDILNNNSASVLHHNISYGVVAAITVGLGIYFVRKGATS